MKISETGNSIDELISQYKIDEEKASSETEKQAAASAVQEEKVSLSSAARDIQKAGKAFKKLPDVREERVRELQNQIETERYDVNGEKIAGKMITESILDVVV